MTIKNKTFNAHLVKYRNVEMEEPVWFWINPASGVKLSPQFQSQGEAEKWFDDVIQIHNETYDLLDRVKNGKFYTLKGKVEFPYRKVDEVPFTHKVKYNTITLDILETSVEKAKEKAEQYVNITKWYD